MKANEDYALTVCWDRDSECFITRCDDWIGIIGTGDTVIQSIESLHSAWTDTIEALPDITERPKVMEKVWCTEGTR